jgi:Tfp pilus assembly protein PilZ
MPERRVVRIIPRRPIPVEIMSADLIPAQGTLANVSELGVCLWTDRVFAAGDTVVLGLGFPEETQPFHAAGCVVWSERAETSDKLCRCGLRWPYSAGPHREMLMKLIATC